MGLTSRATTERCAHAVLIDEIGVFNDKLRDWEDYYNYHRLHGTLEGQTPYERLKQSPDSGVTKPRRMHR